MFKQPKHSRDEGVLPRVRQTGTHKMILYEDFLVRSTVGHVNHIKVSVGVCSYTGVCVFVYHRDVIV